MTPGHSGDRVTSSICRLRLAVRHADRERRTVIETTTMSKVIKQMEMDALKQTFEDVRDLVVLSVKGLTASADNQLRLTLRKKKHPPAGGQEQPGPAGLRRAGHEDRRGLAVLGRPDHARLGRRQHRRAEPEIESELKNPRQRRCTRTRSRSRAPSPRGRTITFEQALKMPTREEAIGRIVGADPRARRRPIAGCLTGPASQVASQIKTISEKKEDRAERRAGRRSRPPSCTA